MKTISYSLLSFISNLVNSVNSPRDLLRSGLIALIFMSLSSWSALADTVTGNIVNDGANRPLQLRVVKNGPVLSIDSSQAVNQCLRRLRNGDLVTVQGTYSADKRFLTVESIDRVGLQELLGAWRSDRWEIFEFKNFSQLAMYIPNEIKNKPRLTAHTRFFRYALTPEQDGGFSIFMSDESDVRLGFLKVSPNQLVITVLDARPGHPPERITLAPLRIK